MADLEMSDVDFKEVDEEVIDLVLDLTMSRLPEPEENKRREGCHYTAQVPGGVCKMCPRKEKEVTGEDKEVLDLLANSKEEAKVEEVKEAERQKKSSKVVKRCWDEGTNEAAGSSLRKIKRRKEEEGSKEDVNKREDVNKIEDVTNVDDKGFFSVAVLKNTFTSVGQGKKRRQKMGINFEKLEDDEPCGLCEQVLNSKKSLGSHVRRKHNMGMRTYHSKVGRVLQGREEVKDFDPHKENEEENFDQIHEEEEKAKVTPKRKKPALNRIENPKEAKKDYTCGICNKFQKDANGRSSHVARNHKIKMEDGSWRNMKMEEYHIIVETAAANMEGGFETEKALGGDAADPQICIAHLSQSANYAENLAKDIIQNVLKLVVDGKEDEFTDEERAVLKLPQKDKEEHAKENVTVENVKKEDALADHTYAKTEEALDENALIECIDIEEEDDNAKENDVEENDQVEHMEGANDHLLVEEDEREGAENLEIFDEWVEKEIEVGNYEEDDDIQIIDEMKAPEPDDLDEILNFQDGEVDQTTKEDQPAGEGVAEEENAKKVRVEDEANQNTQKENTRENEKPEDKTAEVDDEEENENVDDKKEEVEIEEENEDEKEIQIIAKIEGPEPDDVKADQNKREDATAGEKLAQEENAQKVRVEVETIAKEDGEKMSGFLSAIWRMWKT